MSGIETRREPTQKSTVGMFLTKQHIHLVRVSAEMRYLITYILYISIPVVPQPIINQCFNPIVLMFGDDSASNTDSNECEVHRLL
jgi:hypothetical protein